MATPDAIARLRQVIGDTDLSDAQLGAIIDEFDGDLDASSRWVWRMKAAGYVTVVDVAESGSSRKLSDMFDHALKMASFDGDGDGEPGVTPVGKTRTRRIVRE